ncbi:hypothetical protein ACNVD4_08955, partial [Rhizobium sp. BR5]
SHVTFTSGATEAANLV